MGAIKREMNNPKWTAIAIGYMCGFAYLTSLVVYQIGGLITGEVGFRARHRCRRGRDRPDGLSAVPEEQVRK